MQGKQYTTELHHQPLVFLIHHFAILLLAQPGLKLTILLSQPPGCWDYRCVPTIHLRRDFCIFLLSVQFYSG